MRVAERLAQRETAWRELDLLLSQLANRRKLSAAEVLRLGELYRSACTDLMLADDHDLPRETVAHLQALVARAHNLVYRATGFQFRDLGRALFYSAPRRLRHDPALRLATVVFWGVFLFSALLAAGRSEFAPRILGEPSLESFDHMYAEPVNAPRQDGHERNDTAMAGFYIQHNTSIGLQCFAWGILFGLGSLYQLFSNGLIFGTLFGYMATRPHGANFFEFVTAHSAFELTAIIVASAAGMRLGLGLDRHPGAVANLVAPPRGSQFTAGGGRLGRALRAGGPGRRLRVGLVAALLGQGVRRDLERRRHHRLLALGGRGEPASRGRLEHGRPLDRGA